MSLPFLAQWWAWQTCTHGGPCRLTLNPRFVEHLMGWPIGWTAFEPAETAWSQWWQRWRSWLSANALGVAEEPAS